jgi:hypothetical protein
MPGSRGGIATDDLPWREIGWRALLIDAELDGLAEEQAALLRVATLVARGVPAEELFKAVTEEVGRVLSIEFVHLLRYEPDGMATALAAFGAMGRHLAAWYAVEA